MNNCCLITANRHQRQDQWASAERRWTCLWQCYPEIYHGEELLGHFKTQWMAWCGSQTEMIWDHGVVVWASSLKLKEDPSKQFSFSISSSKHDSTIFTHSFWVCSSWPMPLLFWPSVSHKRPNVKYQCKGVQIHRKHHLELQWNRFHLNTAEFKPNQVHGGIGWLLLKIKWWIIKLRVDLFIIIIIITGLCLG